MGYDAISMKGKKIRVEPVAAVATPELGALLEAALKARAAVVRVYEGLRPVPTDAADAGMLCRCAWG